MVTAVLRELAGPYPLLPFIQEPWFLREPLGRHLTTAWEQTRRRVAHEGTAEELHATRDDYEIVLLGYLRILSGYLTLMSRFGGEPQGEIVSHISLCLEQLQKHYDALFPRWQTLDDLRAMLRERAPHPAELLRAVITNSQPPQNWQDSGGTRTPTD